MKFNNQNLPMHLVINSFMTRNNIARLLQLIIATSIMLTALETKAQKYETNNTDLKSSYCISVLKIENAEIEDMTSYLNANKLEEGTDFIQSINDAKIANKEIIARIGSYLNPRRKFLDENTLLLAQQQGSTDVKIFNKCVSENKCSSEKNYDSFASCKRLCSDKTGGLQQKIESCKNTNWLPF